ncbi:polysaccharide deacetylase family protein [Desulfopila sp. IMCC35008]|uniref:polysaccharide deacetylase family protein n=1 Tax=Desulfopila sp. IMCC35008 TaxID=2653858 RepID=UPI0013D45068|nr:polysaccharide deacetylase family protein [Desulfopila sp. IMCC35008]
MNYRPSTLYRQKLPNTIKEQIYDAIGKGIASAGNTPIQLFFRADDIGVPSASFTEMIHLFQKHQTPLCLATVPSWLTSSRFRQLEAITGHEPNQWCWHQHGRLHKNFEPEGKKQEFGPARDYQQLMEQLDKGKTRLQSILDDRFIPFFTPPWNRCSEDTIRALKRLEFKGLSRSAGAQPDSTPLLPDIQVNVDLHTRKETDPAKVLNDILNELEQTLANGRTGIMLHHQRMNTTALLFLDLILACLTQYTNIRPMLLQDFIQP